MKEKKSTGQKKAAGKERVEFNEREQSVAQKAKVDAERSEPTGQLKQKAI